MGFLDKAKGLLAQNADKVEQFAGQAIDKAGDLVDDKTGGKFAGVVDKAQEAAKDAAKKALADGDNADEQS
ncbi:antitoxin [[Mycobacterium] nativiensis]|uniref:Antitoxin n=1 Tax=[Mycobacterium] nativiensis TaxID=2855503 RepID=A0ABU5Y395_9MYCO|nr:antitoxin [Mycolicibacter sp. MYC340]MEB3034680.1 antitoxin [Mycolicibacter sp. MYC340]